MYSTFGSRGRSSPRSLQTLSFLVGHTPGNNLLHQFILDHSDPDHSCCLCSQAYTERMLQLMYDAPVNGLNYERWSSLHLAVLKNNVSMVKILLFCLRNRINVNIEGKFGKTPLHIASEYGHDEVVKELLKAPGILVNGNYQTPLYIASKNGHVKVVKELVKAPGILVNGEDCCGQTPLSIASENGHIEVVKELLKAPGILVDEFNSNRSPLYIASENGHDMVVKELLKAPGILVNEKNCGKTPLYIASENGHVKVVQELLQAPGILVNKADGHQTPLYIASKNGHAKVVGELLKAPGILNRSYTPSAS